jgi:hypothetical protein
VCFFVATAALVFCVISFTESTVTPPRHTFAFNHQAHVAAGLGCTDCHSGAKSAASAGVPDQSVCWSCHETAQGKSPAEAQFREMVAKKVPVTFRPATELSTAGVFFSHRRHVKVAKIDCETCHGAMKVHARPPAASTVPLDMNYCLNCHAKQGASQDCLACHR